MLIKKGLLKMDDIQGSWSLNLDLGPEGVKKLVPIGRFGDVKKSAVSKPPKLI